MDNIYLMALIAMIISFVSTPFVRKFAIKTKIISVPKEERRIHDKPIPLLGGISIYLSFIITLILKKGPIINSEWGIIIGATIIVIGGILDDKFDIKPWQKIVFQLSSAIVLIIFNVKITFITDPIGNGSSISLGWFSIPFTIIWVIGITNALNLIDGLDGLAAGISFISALTIHIVAILNDRAEAAILTAVLGGAVLGFLPYNFNPASIFMGDTGSQLLGFLLAAISIEGAVKSAAAFAIAVPILALGLPIYDTIFAIVRRKVNKKPIMEADKGHLHHRLLDMGLTQKQVVIIMYIISAILGAIAIIAMQLSDKSSYFLLILVIIILVLLARKFGIFDHDD